MPVTGRGVCSVHPGTVKGPLLSLVTLVLGLAAVEVGLRAMSPAWTLFLPPVCFRPDLFEQVTWGYRMWPSRTFDHDYPPLHPRRVRVTTNAEGFRGPRDLHTADTRPRIVVAGDSMVFGEGVEEAERATEVLEAMKPTWRVDNLGMIGYGPDLMLRALEAEGLEPRPAVVVLVLFTDDLRRVAPLYAGVGFAIPRFALDDGRLVDAPYPEPRFWERTRLGQGFLYAWWRYTGAAFPLTAAILDRFRADAASSGFRATVAFAPGPRERFDDRRRERFLETWAVRTGTPFLDLRAALAASGPDGLYIPDDPHWSVAGQRHVAEALRTFLETLSVPE